MKCSETPHGDMEMLLSAQTSQVTRHSFNSFNFNQPISPRIASSPPVAHVGVLFYRVRTPLSAVAMSPSWIGGRRKNQPPYSVLGNTSPTPHCRNDHLTGRFKTPYLPIPDSFRMVFKWFSGGEKVFELFKLSIPSTPCSSSLT